MSKYQEYLSVKAEESRRLTTLESQLSWPEHVTLTSQDYETLSKQRDIVRSAIAASEKLVDGATGSFSNFQTLPLEKNDARRKAKIDDLFGKLTEAAKVFDLDKVKVVRLAIAAAAEQVEKKTGYNPATADI